MQTSGYVYDTSDPRCERLTGTIITSPLHGRWAGAVFVEPHRPLYLMPKELFHIENDPHITRSRHIRMEEFFEFGDNITFEGGNGFVLGIERIDQKVYEVVGENNELLESLF
ncbi:hypothetical protein L596_013323 [Steinernema carpocapsae]|uniref:Uncharacterized protein n=1 Tax=Steinernema carpocapsae TaxID=34508 RepID=A0A4U5P0N3_STECR|nr:hypothetical protein L596_013323 [Steinernema carpocapsae]